MFHIASVLYALLSQQMDQKGQHHTSHILSLGREAIFCNWRLSLRHLHVIHLEMNDLTVALQFIIQNSEELI